MRDVTPKEVEIAMIKNHIDRVDHHECGFCGHMVYYSRGGTTLFFDPGCDCTLRTGRELRTWSDAADFINMQTKPGIRKMVAKRFGIDLEITGE